jgi:uncharacterized protein YdhG (YjbR/CyaY superfamily)
MEEGTKFTSVEEYHSGFPKATMDMLKELRRTIQAAAPEAEEIISYNMPAYKLKGMLVYYAGYSKHIGFYPGASGIEHFKKEIAGYKWAKGSVQFPLEEPLPLTLVTKIVKFRVKENLERAALKTGKK